MASTVLGDKDVNVPMAEPQPPQEKQGQPSKDVKSMEYHRQVFQSKMAAEDKSGQYVSPSDNIMSPCTAKINALRNKQAAKVKPKSLFARASAKKMSGDKGGDDNGSSGDNALGARDVKA